MDNICCALSDGRFVVTADPMHFKIDFANDDIFKLMAFCTEKMQVLEIC